jgi:hypothetical protein
MAFNIEQGLRIDLPTMAAIDGMNGNRMGERQNAGIGRRWPSRASNRPRVARR